MSPASQENLLQKIANPEHAFNKLIKISEDFTKITTFAGNERVIYSDKGVQFLEALGREIFVQLLLGAQKIYYTEEYSVEDSNRIDLSSKLLGSDSNIIQNISEFKNAKSNINIKNIELILSQAMEQIYVKYIKDKPQAGYDFFVSVVIMDVERLVNKPENIEKYLTVSPEEKESEGLKLFEEYGIYVETRKYSEYSKKIENNKRWFELPVYCMFEMMPLNNIFNESVKIVHLSQAPSLPTASSEFGIKNVRDIKDPAIFSSKRSILTSITETTIKAYFANDRQIIANSGKEKDFMFVEEDSIYHKKVFDQGIDKGRVQGVLSTLNGAIVDGQNSIDCFKIILDATKDLIDNGQNYKEQESWYVKLKEDIHQKFPTKSDKESFVRFVESSYIIIKTTQAKNNIEAKEVAIAKNNTMQVGKDELAIANNSDRVSIISQELFKKVELIIYYPKKRNAGISEKMLREKSIGVSELSLYNENANEIVEKNFIIEHKSIFTTVQQLSNKKNNKIHNFVVNYSYSTESEVSPEEAKSKSKIKEISAELRSRRSNLQELVLELEELNVDLLGAESEEFKKHIQKQIEKKESKLVAVDSEILSLESDKDLEDKRRKSLIHTKWKAKELDKLTNLFRSILLTKDLVKKSKLVNGFTEVSSENIFQSVDYTINFIFTVIQLKNKIDFNTKSYEAKEVEKVISEMLKVCDWFKENKFSLTDIRNSKEGSVLDSAGNTLTKDKVRQDLFAFFGL